MCTHGRQIVSGSSSIVLILLMNYLYYGYLLVFGIGGVISLGIWISTGVGSYLMGCVAACIAVWIMFVANRRTREG